MAEASILLPSRYRAEASSSGRRVHRVREGPSLLGRRTRRGLFSGSVIRYMVWRWRVIGGAYRAGFPRQRLGYRGEVEDDLARLLGLDVYALTDADTDEARAFTTYLGYWISLAEHIDQLYGDPPF